MDLRWWQVEGPQAFRDFAGAFITSKKCKVDGVLNEHHKPGGNSGAGAISLAAWYGAKRIILLGCDCKYDKEGKRHWHGNHVKGLGNCVSVPKFPDQFREIARAYYKLTILNCSPDTALTIWPQVELTEALWPTK